MRLSEATWTEAADADATVALLPVGSTEQHGPHAPLGTDTLAAEAVAEAGAAAAEESVVVGPTVPVGVAAEHRQFAGTCWVSPDTFRAYVGETVESLASHGWDRVVVVNGHGGNVDALREVCVRLFREELAYAVPFTWFDAVDPAAAVAGSTDADGTGADRESIEMGHGGAVETSLLRHVHPDLVDDDRLADASAGGADCWGDWVAGANLAYDAAEFSDNGVVGDPAASDPETGGALLSAATTRLATLIEAVATRDATPPDHR